MHVNGLQLLLVPLLLSLLPSIYPQAVAALEGGGQAYAVQYRPIGLLTTAAYSEQADDHKCNFQIPNSIFRSLAEKSKVEALMFLDMRLNY